MGLLVQCSFVLAYLAILVYTKSVPSAAKVVCYYNSKSHLREGQGKFEVSDIEPALSYCTHLIYGYAGINDKNKINPLNEHFDTVQDNYRKVTDLKRNHPNLKVLLSVGGNEDITEDDDDRNLRYRTLIETADNRLAFINSAHTLVTSFGFDGIDLAWEFPETIPKKIRGTLGNFWKKVKTKIVGEDVMDDKADEHREQFTAFVREIKNFFKDDNLLVSLSVLPNVNSTVYYDVRALSPYLDLVNLQAFDFYNPERNPKEADFPSPLYELIDRKYDENADYQVRYWLLNGAQANKVVLAVPAYARTWKMTSESNQNALPPLLIDGPGQAGPFTKDAGLLSFPEVCQTINGPQNSNLYQKVVDSTKRKGNYFYRLPDNKGEGGIWAGYEDVDTISNKAGYAKAKGLGGVALVDITLDDFHGQCGTQKYPLLRAIKSTLGVGV